MTLLVDLVCATLLVLGPASRSPDSMGLPVARASGATPFEFPLIPATGFPSAAGRVTLRRVWSPFGVTVNTDGRVVYDVVIEAQGLPAPTAGTHYIAWLATPTLDRVRRLGLVSNGVPLSQRTDWSQLLVVVSLETNGPGNRWSGPAVLFGRSRSALIRPLWGHSLFRRVPF